MPPGIRACTEQIAVRHALMLRQKGIHGSTSQPPRLGYWGWKYTMNNAYEVRNPSFSDMTLDQQIEAGINDWCAEGASGHPYFGQSKAEAEAIRAQYGAA